MPELPEVEHLRRTLEPVLVGARVTGVDLRRPDVLRIVDHYGRTCRIMNPSGSRSGRDAEVQRALLVGDRIVELFRHGKNLAIIADSGRVLTVHLGMSGQMWHISALASAMPRGAANHVHSIWQLKKRAREGTLIFRDPRRFGGLWAFESREALHEHRLSALGPDALEVRAAALADALRGSKRAIKSVLLDQTTLAGVGNIYADEALFRARIHPAKPAGQLSSTMVEELGAAIRTVLRQAIKAGGSTIRDYVDGAGEPGQFTLVHQVYGRGGEPCRRCGATLLSETIGQRTTVFCRRCQR